MQPSTIAQGPSKPGRIWVLITILAGILGAFAGIAAAGRGLYDITPFQVRLEVRPAPAGKTELRVQPAAIPGQPGLQTEAGTHAGPLAFRATIVGTSSDLLAADARRFEDPYAMANLMREQGRAAFRSFAIKLAIGALAGALTFGMLIGIGRWRRTLGAVAVGFLTLAVLGLIVYQTYDAEEFSKPQWQIVSGEG